MVDGVSANSRTTALSTALPPSGSVSSPWVTIMTLEASPAGLANFTVEQREQGRALLLVWDEPSAPNGIITVHTQNPHHIHIYAMCKAIDLHHTTYLYDSI